MLCLESLRPTSVQSLTDFLHSFGTVSFCAPVEFQRAIVGLAAEVVCYETRSLDAIDMDSSG